MNKYILELDNNLTSRKDVFLIFTELSFDNLFQRVENSYDFIYKLNINHLKDFGKKFSLYKQEDYNKLPNFYRKLMI